MNIYLVDIGCIKIEPFDYFDSFVCVAENEEQARNMHPSNNWDKIDSYKEWCTKEDCKDLQVALIGTAIGEEARVVLASYNNG